jgi:hypothetical protein
MARRAVGACRTLSGMTGDLPSVERVGDAEVGFSFVPPPRFAAARNGARFVLSSDEDPGLLLVVPHDAPAAAALARQLAEGWVEPEVELRPVAPPRRDADGLLAELSGRVRDAEARALLLAAQRSGGGGVLVLALVTAAHWDARRYDAFLRMIVRSLRWPDGSAPGTDRVAEVDAWLRGRVLVRVGAAAAAGVFATWGARQELRLGQDGRFEAVGLLGAAGRRAVGRWRLLRAGGGVALELFDDDGGVAHVRVEAGEEGTFLDGQRFYVGE